MAYKVLRLLSPATATTQDYTSSGFGTPTAAIIYATQASVDGTATDHLNLSFGVYDGTSQWCCGGNSEHGQTTTDTAHVASTSNCLQLATPGTATTIVAATASFITDGVRLTFSTATNQVLVTVILFTDVGTVKAGSTALSTQNTEVNVNTVGFNPKLLIACCVGDTVSGDYFLFSLGMTDQTTQKCFAWELANNAAAADPRATLYSNRIAAQHGTYTVEASNFDADGFSLTARDATSAGDLVFWLAMECPDNDVWVGGFANPTTISDWDVSNGTFQPDFALEIYTRLAAEDAAAVDLTAGVFALGVATASEDMCIALSEEDLSDPTDTQSLVDADTMVRLRQDSGGALLTGEFSSFQSTGRRVAVSTTQTAFRHFGLQMTSGGGATAPQDLADFAVPPPRVHEIFRECVTFLEP